MYKKLLPLFAILTIFIFADKKVNATEQQFIVATADATVYSGSPSSNYGNYAYLETSYETASLRQEMAYFKFNISGLPSNATIVSSKLWVYLKTCNGSLPSNILNIGRATSDWTESQIKWSNRPSLSSIGSAAVPCGTTNLSFDVTSTVQGWITGSSTNYGFVLYGGKSGTWDRNFYSRENDNDAYQPQLMIAYDIPAEEPPADEPPADQPPADEPASGNGSGDEALPPEDPGFEPAPPDTSTPADDTTFPEIDDINNFGGVEDMPMVSPLVNSIGSTLFCLILLCCCPVLLIVFLLVVIKMFKGKKKAEPTPAKKEPTSTATSESKTEKPEAKTESKSTEPAKEKEETKV